MQKIKDIIFIIILVSCLFVGSIMAILIGIGFAFSILISFITSLKLKETNKKRVTVRVAEDHRNFNK